MNARDDSRVGRGKDDEARPAPGEKVILLALPSGFLDGLLDEDERAIAAMIGKPECIRRISS